MRSSTSSAPVADAPTRSLVARAPTRIDFGGGWTDVPPYSLERGGCVCNVAITRRARIRLRALPGRVVIDDNGTRIEGTRLDALPPGAADLPVAALRHARLDNVEVSLRCDFPPGAGLGGSSAVGVALQAAFAGWRSEQPMREELAERSRAVEVDELGVAGGRQDHYAAALGGALHLEFGERTAARGIVLSPSMLGDLQRRCVIVYTGHSRISGETIRAVLDAYVRRDAEVTAALDRMKELAALMSDSLEKGSVDDLGLLVAEHWERQRTLHSSITTEEIERVMEAAQRAGAIGGKALGASGGGCVLLIARDGREGDLREAVARVGELVPFSVDEEGVTVAEERSGTP